MPALLYPQQADSPDIPGFEPVPEFDDGSYMDNRYYPDQLVEVSSTAIVRGNRIAHIKVYPMSYNPVTSDLRIFSKMNNY